MTMPDRKSAAARVHVGGLLIDPMTEDQVVQHVCAGWADRRGGWIVTPNVDIWRQSRREPACAALIAEA
ncbi:MAG: WecB/TagA/CpsF family glycosyltransferase, partial [Angustibacter sp.]